MGLFLFFFSIKTGRWADSTFQWDHVGKCTKSPVGYRWRFLLVHNCHRTGTGCSGKCLARSSWCQSQDRSTHWTGHCTGDTCVHRIPSHSSRTGSPGSSRAGQRLVFDAWHAMWMRTCLLYVNSTTDHDIKRRWFDASWYEINTCGHMGWCWHDKCNAPTQKQQLKIECYRNFRISISFKTAQTYFQWNHFLFV